MSTMRRWPIRIVVLVLLWVVLPGAMEASEDVAYFLSNGHRAHAAEREGSPSDPGPEHGCSAMYHLCSCHLTPPVSLAATSVASYATGADWLFVDRTVHGSTGHSHNIDHPPRS